MSPEKQRPGASHPGSSKLSRRQAADTAKDSAPGDGAEQLDLLAMPVPDSPASPKPGRARAEKHADDWWMSAAMQAVRALAATGRRFQAFDVVSVHGVPEPDAPCRWGALMSRANREGLVELVGAEPSRRPTVHGALTRVWVGKRAAA